jgi:hypothetical protein
MRKQSLQNQRVGPLFSSLKKSNRNTNGPTIGERRTAGRSIGLLFARGSDDLLLSAECVLLSAEESSFDAMVNVSYDDSLCARSHVITNKARKKWVR